MPSGTRRPPGRVERNLLVMLRQRVGKYGEQSNLARAAGISQPQLSRYLAGKKSMPMTDLEAICEALHLSLVEVLREAEREDSGLIVDVSPRIVDVSPPAQTEQPTAPGRPPRGDRQQ